jgi:hypothetical protein
MFPSLSKTGRKGMYCESGELDQMKNKVSDNLKTVGDTIMSNSFSAPQEFFLTICSMVDSTAPTGEWRPGDISRLTSLAA